MSKGRDGIWMGGVGSDIFGEHNAARRCIVDPVNDTFRDKYLGEYINWHRANHRFYDNFESDLFKQRMMRYQTFGYAFGAAAFAAIVINPNFTKRRSYYARKIIPTMFGIIGYQYGYRNEGLHWTNMLLQMNEYFPLEVKRTMQTKDYRHIANFNYKNPGRELFDKETGKALS